MFVAVMGFRRRNMPDAFRQALVHSLVFTNILNTNYPTTGGGIVGFDNFSFNAVTPVLQPVPKPASLALIGLGLAGLVFVRCRMS